MLRFLSFEPFSDAMDTGGGGGGAPTGGNPAPSGGAGGGAQATPTPIALTKDSLIHPEGFEKPITYGEWQSRYVDKSQYTQVTQQQAAREKQWQDYVAGIQQQLNRQSQQPPQGQPQGGGFAQELEALSGKSYVSGAEAAQLVQKLVQHGINPLNQRLQQRDEVIKLLYNKLQGVDQTVGGLAQGTTQAATKALYQSAKQFASLPDDPVVEDFMQDIYLSHEGKDLNQEFPNMVKTRWMSLVKAVREWDKAQAAKARQGGIGRGGNATPGKPAKRGFETAEDIAKAWFPLMNQGNDT